MPARSSLDSTSASSTELGTKDPFGTMEMPYSCDATSW